MKQTKRKTKVKVKRKEILYKGRAISECKIKRQMRKKKKDGITMKMQNK